MSVEVNIKKDFGIFKLNIDFKSNSRRIGILGASGCGKSLTLKSIAGIEKPDEGRIAVNGKVMCNSAKKVFLSPQERRIGYLFQNYALFPMMTVEKNIGIGLKCGKAERKEKVRKMIERFHLQGLEEKLPSELSGGQQQRVALARILVYEPDVILLDEPFSALDVYLKDKMQRECMEMLADYEGTVILVSHSRDEIYRFSEETLVIDRGQIIAQKPTKELFENPERVAAAKLTGCKNIACVEKRENGFYIPDWDITLPFANAESRSVAAVGIRAHEFEREKTKNNENFVFKVYEPKITEDLFEYNIEFKPSKRAAKTIDWKVPKVVRDLERGGMPGELYLSEKNILLLK